MDECRTSSASRHALSWAGRLLRCCMQPAVWRGKLPHNSHQHRISGYVSRNRSEQSKSRLVITLTARPSSLHGGDFLSLSRIQSLSLIRQFASSCAHTHSCPPTRPSSRPQVIPVDPVTATVRGSQSKNKQIGATLDHPDASQRRMQATDDKAFPLKVSCLESSHTRMLRSGTFDVHLSTKVTQVQAPAEQHTQLAAMRKRDISSSKQFTRISCFATAITRMTIC